MVDKDLLDWLRSEADERGWKYQSLLNHILRQAKALIQIELQKLSKDYLSWKKDFLDF